MAQNTAKTSKPSKLHSRFSGILLRLFVLVCLLPLAWGLYKISSMLYGILAAANMGYFACDLACLTLSFASLIFSLPYLLAEMFFTKDIEFLLPMPFHSWQVAGAKMLNVLLSEYLTVAFIGIPLFLGIGISANCGIGFWVSVLLILLSIPVLPLVYGSVLGFFFVFLTRRMRHREAVTTLFSILAMILSMCISMFSSYIGENITADSVLQMILDGKRLILGAFYLFPNLFLAQKALAADSIAMAFAYLASAAAFFAVFLVIGNFLYLKSIVGLQEVSQTRRTLSRSQEERYFRVSGAVRAFALKEWRLLFRTPVYFLNCVAAVFLLPFILLAMFIVSMMQVSAADRAGFSKLLALLAQRRPDVSAALVLLAAVAVTAFLGSTSTVASTCISREGSDYIYLKFIPVPYKKQFQGKMLTALLIGLAATLPYTAILCIFGTVVLQTPAWLILPAFAANVFTVMTLVYMQCIGDLWKPKLDWSSEQAAVEQNMTVLLTMMLSLVLYLALGALAIALYMLGISARLIAVFGICLLGVLAFSFRAIARRYWERAMERL